MADNNANPLKNPSASLLIALGSAVIHAQEFMSPGGHPIDKETFDSILAHEPVKSWLEQMDRLAFLPVKRT